MQGALVGSTCALSFMTWLCFKAQHAIATGELKFATKDVSTSGCSYHFIAEEAMSMLAINETTAATNPRMNAEPVGFQIYHISYLWYTLIGCSICIVISLIVSYITGPNKPNELNPNLLAPFVRKLIKPRPSETASSRAENIAEVSFQLLRTETTETDLIGLKLLRNETTESSLSRAPLLRSETAESYLNRPTMDSHDDYLAIKTDESSNA